MSIPLETCRDEQRRAEIRASQKPGQPPVLNGIDYLEVGADQRTLTVSLLHEVPKGLTSANVRVDGGQRITGITVLPFKLPDRHHGGKPVTQFTVKVDRAGDFSPYTLRLVEPDAQGRPGETPLAGFDPFYAGVEFSFKVDCPTGLDCAPANSCAPEAPDEPAIDYLTKDYAGFRQLIFDRLSLIMPSWSEQHAPDLGVALVEVLAYVGDYLSYLQDAVATEAYLGTARQRISVRRHVRLVDYFMHEGCNARAWVCLKAASTPDKGVPDKGVPVDLSTARFVAGGTAPGSTTTVVFEALPPTSITLYEAHNEIHFYTWDNRECCIPRGATSATLWSELPAPATTQPAPSPMAADAKHQPQDHGKPESAAPSHGYGKPPSPPPTPLQNGGLSLVPGDVLIFEEVRGPHTGNVADADARQRCAVRLTAVTPMIDPLKNTQIYEVEWAAVDALPFTLCISTLGAPPLCAELKNVSVARGNVVLVDQGSTVSESLPLVPASPAALSKCVATGHSRDVPQTTMPYRPPPLKQYPLTQSVPFPVPGDVARRQARFLAGLMDQVRAVLPALVQQVKHSGKPLDQDGVASLGVIFGNHALANVGLIEWDTWEYCPLDAADQIKALNRLLAREEWVLAPKAHRVRVLTGYARSGYVLTAEQVAEIGQMFGAQYADNLQPDAPQWLGPAQQALVQDPRAALPQVYLKAEDSAEKWTPATDLLSSQATDRNFVVEIDDGGLAWLRFGDGNLGAAPTPGTQFLATYRVGNGTSGNVPAESITKSQGTDTSMIVGVRNPLPAVGGVDPEAMDEVKLYAPGAFRTVLKRAVTAADYQALADLVPGVQSAAASLRYTGGLSEMQVAIDPLGTDDPDPSLMATVMTALEPYRRIGHDLRVVQAGYIALDVALSVNVQSNYLRGNVEAALLRVFSSTVNPDGGKGMFHPDNLKFGQAIELSRLIAAAQGVAGVQSVTVTRLRRLGDPNPAPGQVDAAVTAGILPFGPLEVPRLDNDPSFPEHGIFALTLRGGR